MNVIPQMTFQGIFNICIFVELKVTEVEILLYFSLHVSIFPFFDSHKPVQFNFAEA